MRTNFNPSLIERTKRWLFAISIMIFAGCGPSESERLQSALQAERVARQEAVEQAARSDRASFIWGCITAGVVVFFGFAWYFKKPRILVQEKIIERPVVKEKIIEKIIREPSTIIARTPAHDVEANSFVIDALNVVHGGGERLQRVSLLNLIVLLIELSKRGASIKCFSDANMYHVLKEAGLSDHANAYRKLCREFKELFITVAAKTRADDDILDYAHRTGAIIISRDGFRNEEYREKYTWLEDPQAFRDRRVAFLVHSGKLECNRLGICVPIPDDLDQALASLSALLDGSAAACVESSHEQISH